MSNRKSIPAGEMVWVTYSNSKHEQRFIITSKSARDYYYLYRVNSDGVEKLGKARAPQDLEDKFQILERLDEKG